eukprot:74775-Chlamydomonas_euryale.AAC.1
MFGPPASATPASATPAVPPSFCLPSQPETLPCLPPHLAPPPALPSPPNTPPSPPSPPVQCHLPLRPAEAPPRFPPHLLSAPLLISTGSPGKKCRLSTELSWASRCRCGRNGRVGGTEVWEGKKGEVRWVGGECGRHDSVGAWGWVAWQGKQERGPRNGCFTKGRGSGAARLMQKLRRSSLIAEAAKQLTYCIGRDAAHVLQRQRGEAGTHTGALRHRALQLPTLPHFGRTSTLCSFRCSRSHTVTTPAAPPATISGVPPPLRNERQATPTP